MNLNIVIRGVILSGLILVTTNCKKESKAEVNDFEALPKRPHVDEEIKVTTEVLEISDFHDELISNGKLTALRKADIPFEHRGYIEKIYVGNGDRVTEGSLMAVLDNKDALFELERAELDMEQAETDLKDKLLGYGYQLKDSLKIPDKIFRYCKIKSNYIGAVRSLSKAKATYNQTRIKAPFSGVVANLEAMPDNLTASFENKLCTLIDGSKMMVQFPLLESELLQVSRGMPVAVFPYSNPDESYNGEVDEINPIIDENGMVMIRAIIKNPHGKLFDGMNVKVLLKNKLSEQLVVPKSAVLQRQNKSVVFTYSDGEAHWNYVKTGKENSTNVIITEGLETGAEVIVSGNINLAHKTKVSIQ
ncbi:efflux RND transporter periplasmic adaptor subunit [Zhouia amylolytica]|uniref:Uncharacterized protein n=1 Tax=Zhouia amylolytica AD3 TaxID=1286632 RepID=W2UR09_9FLAO|nr:efflux RND transporter periplasmic adaptor subunit [Zhouia amylolytica]ETN96374.1 hypothetical protein P278_07180 [Zhouia amylolytica AD3]